MFSRSHLPKVLLYAAALTVGSRRCLAQCLRSDHGKRCQGMWWLERCRRCVSPAKMEIPAACFQRPTSVSAPTPNFYLTPMLKHEIRIQKTCDVRSCKLPLGKEYRAGYVVQLSKVLCLCCLTPLLLQISLSTLQSKQNRPLSREVRPRSKI